MDAEWPVGIPGANATGECRPGYFGTPTRECLEATFTWSPTVYEPCQRAFFCRVLARLLARSLTGRMICAD